MVINHVSKSWGPILQVLTKKKAKLKLGGGFKYFVFSRLFGLVATTNPEATIEKKKPFGICICPQGTANADGGRISAIKKAGVIGTQVAPWGRKTDDN